MVVCKAQRDPFGLRPDRCFSGFGRAHRDDLCVCWRACSRTRANGNSQGSKNDRSEHHRNEHCPLHGSTIGIGEDSAISSRGWFIARSFCIWTSLPRVSLAPRRATGGERASSLSDDNVSSEGRPEVRAGRSAGRRKCEPTAPAHTYDLGLWSGMAQWSTVRSWAADLSGMSLGRAFGAMVAPKLARPAPGWRWRAPRASSHMPIRARC